MLGGCGFPPQTNRVLLQNRQQLGAAPNEVAALSTYTRHFASQK
jgi:hypothetical protein